MIAEDAKSHQVIGGLVVLRIALVSDISPGNIGGVERFAFSMADCLASRKMMIDVYDRSSIEGWTDKWYDKYLVNQYRNMQIGNTAWRQMSAHSVPTDVIIQNSIAGWNLRGKTQIPRIVIHHGSMRGLSHLKFPAGVTWRTKLNRYIGLDRFKGGLEQYTATGAVSVAVSSAVAEELRQYYSGIKPIVIPNGIDTEHFSQRDMAGCRQKYGVDTDAFVACFTGRFGIIGKGFEELRALAVLAWEAQLRIKFLIATDEIPSGWPANVVFVQNVNYDQIPEIYSAADIFVFPTRYEGCSYSLLEAMACKLPVLTTQVGYAKDIQRDIAELSPFIFAENNVEHYWNSLKQLAGDEVLARKLGNIGEDYVRRHNSLDVMVDSYVKLIEQVAKGEPIL